MERAVEIVAVEMLRLVKYAAQGRRHDLPDEAPADTARRILLAALPHLLEAVVAEADAVPMSLRAQRSAFTLDQLRAAASRLLTPPPDGEGGGGA